MYELSWGLLLTIVSIYENSGQLGNTKKVFQKVNFYQKHRIIIALKSL